MLRVSGLLFACMKTLLWHYSVKRDISRVTRSKLYWLVIVSSLLYIVPFALKHSEFYDITHFLLFFNSLFRPRT